MRTYLTSNTIPCGRYMALLSNIATRLKHSHVMHRLSSTLSIFTTIRRNADYAEIHQLFIAKDAAMSKTTRLTKALTAEYQNLFDTCSIQPQHRAAVARLARQLTEQQPRYAAVAQLTHIPWAIIAVIH